MSKVSQETLQLKKFGFDSYDKLFQKSNGKLVYLKEITNIYSYYVVNIAMSMHKSFIAQNGSIDPQDLINNALIGLYQAAERFDPNKGFKFLTYATPYIKKYCFEFRRKRNIHLVENVTTYADNNNNVDFDKLDKKRAYDNWRKKLSQKNIYYLQAFNIFGQEDSKNDIATNYYYNFPESYLKKIKIDLINSLKNFVKENRVF